MAELKWSERNPLFLCLFLIGLLIFVLVIPSINYNNHDLGPDNLIWVLIITVIGGLVSLMFYLMDKRRKGNKVRFI